MKDGGSELIVPACTTRGNMVSQSTASWIPFSRAHNFTLVNKKCCKYFDCMYSGTSLIRTPEMRTPRFNGHFAQVRNHSHSLLYIFTSEMRTPRYSV